jgi:hypothetical protein
MCGVHSDMRCKRTTPFEKLILAYKRLHRDVSRGSLYFQYNGQELFPTQTPDDLEMQDGAVVHALRVIAIE